MSNQIGLLITTRNSENWICRFHIWMQHIFTDGVGISVLDVMIPMSKILLAAVLFPLSDTTVIIKKLRIHVKSI